MTYAYILESIGTKEHYYVGATHDLRARLKRHNAGEVSHTSKYVPWKIKTYMAFDDEAKAFAFERYLKTASGRAFAKKRFSCGLLSASVLDAEKLRCHSLTE